MNGVAGLEAQFQEAFDADLRAQKEIEVDRPELQFRPGAGRIYVQDTGLEAGTAILVALDEELVRRT